MNRVILTLPILLLGLAVAGCSDYSVLDRERTGADALPEIVDAEAIDGETSRLVAEAGDQSFWLARGADRKQICLVVYETDHDWMAACGGSQLEASGAPGKFVVQPDGQPAPEETTRISENVFRK